MKTTTSIIYKEINEVMNSSMEMKFLHHNLLSDYNILHILGFEIFFFFF